MFRRLLPLLSRVVLGAMLLTFLSPAYAWHRIATHDELEHAPHDKAPAHVHDDGYPHPAEQEHHDAHGFAGHVLGHLPAFLSEPPSLPQPTPMPAEFAELAPVLPHVALEPPFRPPRFSSFT
jgi:hypothetical protein